MDGCECCIAADHFLTPFSSRSSTLLFNVKVIRVDKPDGKGGFTRG